MESVVSFYYDACDPIGIAINRIFSPQMQTYYLTPMGRNTKDLITSTDQLKRDLVDILSLDCFDNSIYYCLCMISVGLPCISGWLVNLLPFLQKQRDGTQVSYVFVKLIQFYRKMWEIRDKKGYKYWSNVEISAGQL